MQTRRRRPALSFVHFVLAASVLAVIASAPSAAQSNAHWTKDPLKERAAISAVASDGSRFNLSVACGSLSLPLMPDLRGAEMDVQTESRTPETTFLLSPVKLFPNSPTENCPSVQGQLDSGSSEGLIFVDCGSETRTSVLFPALTLSEYHAKYANDLGTKGAPDNAHKAMAQFLGNLLESQDTPYDLRTIPIHELTDANSLKLGLTLKNGRQSVVDLPVDATLKHLVSSCVPPDPKPGQLEQTQLVDPSTDLNNMNAINLTPMEKESCYAQAYGGCPILGSKYLSGEGVPKDFNKAIVIFTHGCNGGDTNSCFDLCDAYVKVKDGQNALPACSRACAKNAAASCWEMDQIYRYGMGVDLDLIKAQQALDKACSLGWDMGCSPK
jgi:TPR repeat protein